MSINNNKKSKLKLANWIITSAIQILKCTNFHPFAKKKCPKCAKISIKITCKIICAKINVILNNDASASKFAAN